MDGAVILSFIFFMSIFAGIGLASMRVKKDTTDDYLVAGRGMSPPLAALSAVSTWNSGYMFIGFIGFTYTCLLYTSPSPRDRTRSRMPSSA